MGHRISTGVIGYPNDLDYIYVKFVLHCQIMLLFEERKKDTKIRNDLYLQCHDCKDIYQKGYQWSCDIFCDILRDLIPLLIEGDI